MQIKPKNWSHFQHYKDRCPPWIKLHRDLLNNRDFMRLPIASKALAPMLWLLASESKDGSFDGSLDELVFRLHITEKEYHDGIKPLIDKGFFVSDSEVLAPCLQDAIPERETERETKTEKKVATAIVLPDWMPLETWQAFLAMRKKMKRVPTDHAVDLLIKKLDRFRANGQNIQAVLEKSITSNWQDVFEINERQPFANKFDVAHITTPTPPNQDAALRKIEEDRKRAVKPSLEVLARMAELRKKVQA
jgi:hypothetical protein